MKWNIFLCQSIQSQIELEEIADVKRQIITPSSSRTSIGIAQDGLIGAYKLTDSKVRIDRKNAMNIVSYTSVEDFSVFKKSKEELTGHELFSLIIPEKINISKYDDGKPILVIKNGTLTDGYIKGDSLAAGKKNSLVQLIWDEYGVEETKDFMNNTSRLINNFLLWNGFTVGIGDMTIGRNVEEEIQKTLQTRELKVQNMITEIENNPELMDEDLFENTLFSELNVARDDVGKLIQSNNNPDNCVTVMHQSGSKGDANNTGQMSGCIGLQSVEGKLPQKKVNSRTLPYFHENDDTAVARGLVKQSFLRGTRFPEFFFINMAAREGLISSAVLTAESGYIQRKLIKILEDAFIAYDKTVRTANNGILQFLYGDAGSNTIKQYEHTIKLIELNNAEIMKKYCFNDDELKDFKNYTKKDNQQYYDTLLKMRDELRNIHLKTKLDMKTLSSTYMIPVNIVRVVDSIKNANIKSNEKLEPNDVIKGINYIVEKARLINLTTDEISNATNLRNKDDKVAKTLFNIALHEYLSPKRCIIDFKLNKKQFDEIINEFIKNYNKNMIEPGEMVGIIAAQAMGEPITQMSCEKNTKVMIKNMKSNDIYHGSISNFIDKQLNDNKDRVIELPNHTDSVVLDMIDNYYIIGVSEDEKTSWNRIEQISRHPTNGDLMKITTKSGRTTTTTLSHSHLTRKNNKVVPIKGSDLKVGDKIPILMYVEAPCNNHTITIGQSCYDATKEFGWLFGAYLADGLIDGSFISISTNNLEYLINIIKKYFNSDVITDNENTIVFENNDVAKLCLEFGDGLYNKKIPSLVFNTNTDFMSGVICGYYNNSSNKSMISIESHSKELIDGISLMLSYFGIIGSFVNELSFTYQIQNECVNAFKNIINNINNTNNDETNIIWDEITFIEILNDPKEYVYDFTVPGNDTFMVDNGVLVHNTLNAFHSAGIGRMSATTSGVPRIKEILGLSKKIKTPQMVITLTEQYMNSRDMANKIGSYIKYITIGQLRKQIDVYYEPEPFAKGSFREKDNVYNVFYGHNPGKHSCQADISNLPWLMRIVFDREKLLEKEVTLLDIKSKFCNAWEKRFSDIKSSKKEERAIFDKITQCAILSNTNNDDVPIIHIRFDMSEIDYATINEFIDTIVDKFKLKGITSITNSFVNEERVLKYNNEGGIDKINHFQIYTNGVNLYDVRYIIGINIYKTFTNDIIEIYETFGIEAARLAIIRQIVDVYDRAGKAANYQHLTILAEIMTVDGHLLSIDRHGMKKSKSDPLPSASFEKTVDVLLSAAVFGETDHMKGISSRIMAGQVIKGGTGMCDLLLDTDMIEKSEFTEDIGQKYIKTYNEITTSSVISDVIKKDEVGIFIPEY